MVISFFSAITQVVTLTTSSDADVLNYLKTSVEQGVPALIVYEKKNNKEEELANQIERYSKKKQPKETEVLEVGNDKTGKSNNERGNQLIDENKNPEAKTTPIKVEEQAKHQEISIEEPLEYLKKNKKYVRNL